MSKNPLQQCVVLRRPRVKRVNIKVTGSRALFGVAWVGKAALSCFGLVAALALVLVIFVLTPVMLATIALCATTPRPKRKPTARRHGSTTSGLSAPRKAVASRGQQVR